METVRTAKSWPRKNQSEHRDWVCHIINVLIIWQAPRAISMWRILCSDWLSERVRLSNTARPGLPISFPQIKFRQSSSGCTKVFFSRNYFLLRFFVISPEAREYLFILSCQKPENGKTESANENENKEHKNVDEFKKYLLQQKPAKHKSKNTKWYEGVEAVLNLKIWIWNVTNQMIVFCIYPIWI